MDSLHGHLLVAASRQSDPTLAETVILVIEHMEQGAFGVILNCRKERSGTQHDVRGMRMHFGGPVTGPLMALHTVESLAEVELLPGVFFSGREEHVLPLMRLAKQPCKIFTGYTGWGAGQLDSEVAHGKWRLAPATAGHIFLGSNSLWKELSNRQFQLMFDLTYIPSYPVLN